MFDFKKTPALPNPQRPLPELIPVEADPFSNPPEVPIHSPAILPAETYFRLGCYFDDRGESEEACRFFLEAIKSDPTLAPAYNELGGAFQKRGSVEKAIPFYQKAISFQPDFAAAYYNLGNAFKELGCWPEAIKQTQKAIELDPSLPEAHYIQGIAYYEQEQVDEAIASWQKALELNPGFTEVYFNLGIAFYNKGQLEEALALCQKAVELDPSLAEAHYNLGLVYYGKDLPDEAIRCWQKTLQINSEHQDAYNNMGAAFQDKHELEKAQKCFQKAIDNNPDLPEAHWNKSLCHLLAGSFSEGWMEYQWRFRINTIFLNRHFPQPLWAGEDLMGKTILLYAEQGFGDTIQFIRYVPLVKKRGGRVVVECQEDLASLLESMEGIDRLIKHGQPLPDFDVQCPLLSLPLAFKTRIQNIPASIPYFSLNPALIQEWQEITEVEQGDLKIGLVWAGRPTHKKDRKRSLNFEAFEPILEVPGITFFSLQKGEAAQQIQNRLNRIKPINVAEKLADFTETGALIQNLDLVISVDTAVAHLTGALGKPVWTLLPYSPDWRWLLDREDCPWYPSMRLFRQPSPGDWGSVIQSVKDCLLEKTK
jgi:tetratricopeptide (TPR) repeat protein